MNHKVRCEEDFVWKDTNTNECDKTAHDCKVAYQPKQYNDFQMHYIEVETTSGYHYITTEMRMSYDCNSQALSTVSSMQLSYDWITSEDANYWYISCSNT